ncbi:hypothetical protein G6F36_012781 [Rhizopus arrhizus]|nr:hypothetical protein G6F36_012781 [Rhizopus arrhizus]
MRSLLILATLALVCFVDKNSAAAVRRDNSSSIDNAGSPTDAQADTITHFDPTDALDITPADYFNYTANEASATDAAAPATDAASS